LIDQVGRFAEELCRPLRVAGSQRYQRAHDRGFDLVATNRRSATEFRLSLAVSGASCDSLSNKSSALASVFPPLGSVPQGVQVQVLFLALKWFCGVSARGM
jgi:hypothetical protein